VRAAQVRRLGAACCCQLLACCVLEEHSAGPSWRRSSETDACAPLHTHTHTHRSDHVKQLLRTLNKHNIVWHLSPLVKVGDDSEH
jgi:hypothetical protein